MIGKTYSLKKLNKLENQLNSFVNSIEIEDNGSSLDPIETLSLLANDEFEKMFILEMSNHYKLDSSILDLIDNIYLTYISQTIILFKYKYDSFPKGDKEVIDQLILEYNVLVKNYTSKNVKVFNKKNVIFLHVYYKDFFNSDDFSLLKELETFYIKKVSNFRDLVVKGEYPYIESINYLLLKNKLVTYSLVTHPSNKLLDLVSKTLNLQEKSIDLCNDELFLKRIKSTLFEVKIQDVKDQLSPKVLSNSLGISQNDILKIQKNQINYLKELPLDYAILDLENVFKFNSINKYGISKFLYDLLYETHKYHSSFLSYTFEEWKDEKKRESKLFTNKEWKIYILRRIKLIVPNIFK